MLDYADQGIAEKSTGMCAALNSRKSAVRNHACRLVGILAFVDIKTRQSRFHEHDIFPSHTKVHCLAVSFCFLYFLVVQAPVILRESQNFRPLASWASFSLFFPSLSCSYSGFARQILIICNFSQPPFFPLVLTVSTLHSSPHPWILRFTCSGLFCAQSRI